MPMGLVQFGSGRDAADVALATIFGGVRSMAPMIHARTVVDDSLDYRLPILTMSARSTDRGYLVNHVTSVP